ncbi:MAG: hypothetical protein ACI9W4_000055 [Rhodothermales bacterium]|jgi:hypothetical protein
MDPPINLTGPHIETDSVKESLWQERQAVHLSELAPVINPHLDRRSWGQKHPVIDFLFEYYRFRPSALLRWSPGLGPRLVGGASAFAGTPHFETDGADAWVSLGKMSPRLRSSTRWILSLLERTQARAPMFGCHGLHEWAMVYRESGVRHAYTPLRLTPAEIATVVETGPVVCTHFDAFRFFTPDARPLNRVTPEAQTAPDFEQPGCLHVNMDVYRWAMKRYPWISSDLTRDAFLLAMDIRAVDMQASPYDLADLGYPPICIETEDGRAEYRSLQSAFYERARPIRARLIKAYRRLAEALEA